MNKNKKSDGNPPLFLLLLVKGQVLKAILLIHLVFLLSFLVV